MKSTTCTALLIFFVGGIALLGNLAGCGCKPAVSPQKPTAVLPTGSVEHFAKPIENYSVSITGLVRQPVNLTRFDLRSFQSVKIRMSDVRRDGSFHGVFFLRGVPLQTLLEMAHISKESSLFNRTMDIAIVVEGQNGDSTVLSWGEVFYRNGAEIVLAYDGVGMKPHKKCAKCHGEETYKPWLDQIDRAIPYPKLVVTSDRFSDRTIEAVRSIRVVDLGKNAGIHLSRKDAPENMRAEKITITDSGGKAVEILEFNELNQFDTEVIQAGDGTGYHGIRKYKGVSLKTILENHGFGPDPNQAFLLSAKDGYRVLLSNGEVFCSSGGGQIMLADTMNGALLTDSGKYQLVPVNDLSADRWLKAVSTIEPVRFDEKPRLSVKEKGSGDTSKRQPPVEGH